MPFYDYKCPKCEKVEQHLILKSDEVVLCEPCAVTMEKQIAASNFQIKGYNAKNNYGLKRGK